MNHDQSAFKENSIKLKRLGYVVLLWSASAYLSAPSSDPENRLCTSNVYGRTFQHRSEIGIAKRTGIGIETRCEADASSISCSGIGASVVCARPGDILRLLHRLHVEPAHGFCAYGAFPQRKTNKSYSTRILWVDAARAGWPQARQHLKASLRLRDPPIIEFA
ncbi:hypothetical protein EVAR_56788_1 [Eumeta japonica]|uniref:Uncharacterized protein n=1 Tax=Eumeta variegata TaxID=151549 RepID=A0A4C1YZD0_EUMVA|nr:hypothetical protein EVAR_56788_1 [Eumeta japonica]